MYIDIQSFVLKLGRWRKNFHEKVAEMFGGFEFVNYICTVIIKEQNDEEAIQVIRCSRFSRRRQYSEIYYDFPSVSSGFVGVLVRYP